MKLIFSIVNNDDSPTVAEQFAKTGIHSTKLSSTGGFLSKQNTTFITGVEDNEVELVLDIIRKHSNSRAVPGRPEQGEPSHGSLKVGGATVFVVDVEQFERI